MRSVPLKFTVDPVTLFDLARLHVHLLSPAVLLVVAPVANVVVAVAIYLTAIATTFLPVLALAFVYVTVGLGEYQSADALTLRFVFHVLTVDVRAIFVY